GGPQESDAKSIGIRLRLWRKSQGLKGYQLADIIHLSQSSLSEIENGQSLPSAKTIVNLMMLEELDIFWLLGVRPPINPSAPLANEPLTADAMINGLTAPNIKPESIKSLIDHLRKGTKISRELETNLNELLHIVES
ncbi:MAG: helix-turn-helix domain-containing protein, partial [Nitrospinae bacterium]|nr:helix-turn-helix domain-containing protein [Nitrospinota bacterium]